MRKALFADTRGEIARTLAKILAALSPDDRRVLGTEGVRLLQQMFDMAQPTSPRQVEQIRRTLLQHEHDLSAYLSKRFLTLETQLQRELDAVMAQASSRVLSAAQAASVESALRRYHELLTALGTELSGMVTLASQGQYARAVLDTLDLLSLADVSLNDQEVAIGARIQLLNRATGGTPFANRFQKEAGRSYTQLTQALRTGIAQGHGVQTIARNIRKAVPHLTRYQAIRLARTETLGAYRQAAIGQMGDYPDVSGWRWVATLDSRTCMACIALHGTIHDIREPFGSHPSCRCTPVPVTRTMEADHYGVDGEKWFEGLDADTARTMMGQTKYTLWDAGEIGLGDLVQHSHTEFGPTVGVRSLSDLRRAGVVSDAQLRKAMGG